MGIVRARRKAETQSLLIDAGLRVFAERGIELGSLDEVAQTAGFTKGAIYRQFPSKGAFMLALFEQYAAVARAGAGARHAPWFTPLTLQFAAHAMRDPLLRRRLDRKSTRLNSSHGYISYAVFCLKKKKVNSVSLNTN